MRLHNDLIVAELAPERGMAITRLSRAGGGANVLWERPVDRLPAPSRDLGPPGVASIDTLHDLLLGGWFEMSPHAGLPGTLGGRETHLHGEAMRLAWVVEEVTDSSVTASVATVTTDLHLTRRIRLEGGTLTVASAIRNRGSTSIPTTHGEHPCFSRAAFAGGSISLETHSCVVLPPLDPANATLSPGEFAWPLAPDRDGEPVDVSLVPRSATGTHDHIAIRLAEPAVEIAAPSGERLSLRVDLGSHPHLLLWRNFGAPGKPGNGLWDTFALEPMSAPGATIDEAVEAGTVRTIGAGEEASYSVAATLL